MSLPPCTGCGATTLLHAAGCSGHRDLPSVPSRRAPAEGSLERLLGEALIFQLRPDITAGEAVEFIGELTKAVKHWFDVRPRGGAL